MSAEKRKKRPWPIRLLRVTVILFAVYLFLGFVILPIAVKLVAPSLVSREIEGNVRLGWVWMNPLVFSVSLRDVSVTGPAAEPVLAFTRLYANADPVRSLFTGELSAAALTLRGLDLRVHIDEGGEINLARAFAPTRPPEPEVEEARDPVDVPSAVLRHFALEDARIHFSDHSRGVPFEKTVTSLNIELNDIRTRPEHENVYEFTAQTGADERIHLRGVFQLNPLSFAGSVEIDGIHLPAYGSFYKDIIDIEIISGRAFGGLDFSFRPLVDDRELGLTNGRFSLEDLDIRAQGVDISFFRLERLAIAGITLELFKHHAEVAEIGVSGITLRAHRLADGSIDLLELLPESDDNAPSPPAAAPASADPLAFGVRSDGEDMAVPFNAVLAHLEDLGESDWRIALGRLQLDDIAVELTDHTTPEPTQVRLHGIGLLVENFSNDPGNKASLDFRMGINEAGRVTLTGEAGVEPLAADVRFEVSELALGDFGPIAETFVPLMLDSAFFDLDGAAALTMAESGEPLVEASANMSIRDFSLRLSGAGEPFMAFRELRVAGARFFSEQMAGEVEEVFWQAPRIRVERREDGRLALLDLLPEEVAKEVEETLGELAVTADSESEEVLEDVLAGLPLQLALGRFRMEDGRIEWIDAGVQPTARLVVSALNLDVTDIHLEPDTSRPTRIDMSATFADEGRIRVEGSLIPADPALQSAAVVDIRDVPLEVFTPYAADAVGRPIRGGTFSGDFDVKVEANALDSTNQLRVQSIRFGSPIAGSSGAALPVGVAVAALQDRRGLISLDVPIRGDLDNPDFQPGRLFIGILRNAVFRALTAPLSIAGSLIGGSLPGLSLLQGEGSGDAPLDLSAITFSSGSSELSPLAIQTLDALAAFLRERPEAQLEVVPSVDPEGDFQAQARETLEARLAETGATSRSQALRQLYGRTFGVLVETDAAVVSDTPAPARETVRREQAPASERSETSSGFYLSDGREREVERGGFYVSGGSPRRPGERGFYSGQPSPESRPEPRPARLTETRAEEGDAAEPPSATTELREMERRLLAEFPADDASLAALAEERAAAVRRYFLDTAGISPDRLRSAPSVAPFRREGARVLFEFATDLE